MNQQLIEQDQKVTAAVAAMKAAEAQEETLLLQVVAFLATNAVVSDIPTVLGSEDVPVLTGPDWPSPPGPEPHSTTYRLCWGVAQAALRWKQETLNGQQRQKHLEQQSTELERRVWHLHLESRNRRVHERGDADGRREGGRVGGSKRMLLCQ